MKVKWPSFIAEIGVNHEGSLDLAKSMIRTAFESGADAVKFQTYKAALIASKNSPSYWDLSEEATQSQYDLFTKYDSFGERDYYELFNYSEELGVNFMSTAFDLDSIDMIDNLVKIHKISSSDITNRPLIEKVASKGKPIILSVGASDVNEIHEALTWVDNRVEVALLHCVLQYPTPNEDANLGQIVALKNEFPNLTIGYSDHTKPQNGEILKIATVLGAEIIEKHYTFDKKKVGNDHYHSFDSKDLTSFMEWRNEYFEKTIGNKEQISYNENELVARLNARRGIYTLRPIVKGAKLTDRDIICRRPFTGGIHPRDYFHIIGKTAINDLNEDTPISYKDIE